MFQSGVVCAIIIVMTVLLSYLSGIILYANDTDHESEGQHFKFHFAKDFNSLVWNTCNRPSKKVLKNETSEKPTQPEKNLQWYIPSIWCSWDDMWWCREGIERWGWGKCGGNISPDSSLWSVVVVLVESTDRLSRFLPPRQLAPGRSSRPGTHLGLLQHRQESSWSSPVTTTLARPPTQTGVIMVPTSSSISCNTSRGDQDLEAGEGWGGRKGGDCHIADVDCCLLTHDRTWCCHLSGQWAAVLAGGCAGSMMSQVVTATSSLGTHITLSRGDAGRYLESDQRILSNFL